MFSIRKCAVVLLLSFLLIGSASAARWYEGGTLHGATIAEWKRATAANQLATCADFLAAAHMEGKLKLPISDVESIRPYANELVTCINAATKGHSEADHQSVSDIAAMGALLMGWLK